jgi:hypothetical protein
MGFDPAMMQQMMQSPMMQQLLNNPDMMRNMLQMNPAVREVRWAAQCMHKAWLITVCSCCGRGGARAPAPGDSTQLVHLRRPTPPPQLMDRDPMIAQLMNNPALVRETLNIMSNPVRRCAALRLTRLGADS